MSFQQFILLEFFKYWLAHGFYLFINWFHSTFLAKTVIDFAQSNSYIRINWNLILDDFMLDNDIHIEILQKNKLFPFFQYWLLAISSSSDAFIAKFTLETSFMQLFSNFNVLNLMLPKNAVVWCTNSQCIALDNTTLKIYLDDEGERISIIGHRSKYLKWLPKNNDYCFQLHSYSFDTKDWIYHRKSFLNKGKIPKPLILLDLLAKRIIWSTEKEKNNVEIFV